MAHRNNNNTNNNGQSVQKELGSETDAVEVIREDENGRYFRHKSTLEHELQGRIAPAPASAFEHGMNSSLWQTSDLSAATIIFASSAAIESWISASRQHRHFFPAEFRPVVSKDLNGRFGSEYHEDAAGRVVGHDSWSCFKIKQVAGTRNPIRITYHWMQIAVFVRLRLEGHLRRPLVFFVDCPDEMKRGLQTRLPGIAASNPYAWHAALVNETKQLYDRSIWALRDLVRDIELQRNASWNFPTLHDIGRHIIHSNETLAVATNTVESIMNDCTIFHDQCPGLCAGNGSPRPGRQVRQQLFLALQELHALKARSVSLNERLQNEINLAFNIVAQHNHQIAVQLGENSRSDNAMMKTVAIVSLFYLPGTFVSGLFGMNFFNFNPNSDPNNGRSGWVVADTFWLYWAITVPLTIATLLLWALWHYHGRFRRIVRQLLLRFRDRRDRDGEEGPKDNVDNC